MAKTATGRPIIIKKKKVMHGGHHGGAWKVAFADFMTAMMAFFLVMWILGLSESTRKGISGYFKEPGIFGFTSGKALPIEVQTAPSLHRGDGSGEAEKNPQNTGAAGAGASRGNGAKDVAARVHEMLAKMAEKDKKLAKLGDAVHIEFSEEGLRLELAESDDITFFNLGGATPTPVTKQVLTMIAGQLKEMGNPIEIEGHTDSRPYGANAEYTNWELSADRANAARKILGEAGFPGNQVKAVTGYADRRLRKPDAPADISNRRVTIVVELPKDGRQASNDPPPPQPTSHFFPISASEVQNAYKARN